MARPTHPFTQLPRYYTRSSRLDTDGGLHLPFRGRCTICLGFNHQRDECFLKEIQDDLRTHASSRDTTLSTTQPLRPTSAYLPFRYVKSAAEPARPPATDDTTYQRLKKTQTRLHVKLCKGRCAKYGHDEGQCGTASFENFERVHLLELERGAARIRKMQRRKNQPSQRRALTWKPRRSREQGTYFFARGGFRALAREVKLRCGQNSPCAGRERE